MLADAVGKGEARAGDETKVSATANALPDLDESPRPLRSKGAAPVPA